MLNQKRVDQLLLMRTQLAKIASVKGAKFERSIETPAPKPAKKENNMNLLAQLVQKYSKDESDSKFIQSFVALLSKDGTITDDQAKNLEQTLTDRTVEREKYSNELKARDEKLAGLMTQFETFKAQADTSKTEFEKQRVQMEGMVKAAELSKRNALVTSVVDKLRAVYWPAVVDVFEKYAKMQESSNGIFVYERTEKDKEPVKVTESFLEAAVEILKAIPEDVLLKSNAAAETTHGHPDNTSDLERISYKLKGLEIGLKQQGYSGDKLKAELDSRKAMLVSAN